ncbi:MAG: extracellular solute-binding protein [Chloroflexi bacterium]|nr:extracellular solute-binding protein [Chloroflexota bacterium]
MRISRRRVLVVVPLGCATTLLAACAPASPVAPTPLPPTAPPATPVAPAAVPTSVAPAPAATSSLKASVLPTYVPLANKPTPDYPTKGELYEDGYLTYPAQKAAPAQAPGLGSSVSVFVDGLYPPPTPLDQNPAWQQINQQLNANVQFTVVPPADYAAKLATLMAGSDYPDTISLFGGLSAAPNLPDFLKQAAADLTPYLGNDAVRAYPNLAALPTFAWRNSGSVIDGRLWTVPISRPSVSSLMIKNSTVWDKEIGPDYTPQNADDFKRVLQQLTVPSQNRWAIGTFQGALSGPFEVAWFASLFGAPNNWRLQPDGTLQKDYESLEYQEAVAYLRDLLAAGVFYPDSQTTTSAPAAMTNLVSGKCVLSVRALGLDWTDGYQQGQHLDPPQTFGFLRHFAAHDGAQAVFFLGTGYGASTMLKQASPDRIRELLGLLNWTAAPFGSQEDLLLTYGAANVDYTLDASGNPVTTDRWAADAYNMPWRYMAQHAQVIYNANYPAFTGLVADAEAALIPIGVSDATLGYYSPTSNAKGIRLRLAFNDGLLEVLQGSRPLGDLDQLVKDWQANGGEDMRKEFLTAIAAG